jgi:hypothetical protein
MASGNRILPIARIDPFSDHVTNPRARNKYPTQQWMGLLPLGVSDVYPTRVTRIGLEPNEIALTISGEGCVFIGRKVELR